MKSLISLFSVAVVLLNVEGSQSSAVKPFYKNQYFGKWYIFGTYCSTPLPDIGQCLSFVVESSPNENVKMTLTYKNTTEKTTGTYENELRFDEPDKGHLTYDTQSGSASADIAAIDYEEYFIEFACDTSKEAIPDFAAVYTRVSDPPKETLKKLYDFLKIYNIDESSVILIEQDVNKCDF